MVSLQAALAVLMLSATGVSAPTQQTVLLDFYADWCGPCRAMQPTVQALEEKGYPLQKVNISRNAALAAQYGVRSVPCYVMLVDGKEVDRVLGSTTFSRLERMFSIASDKAKGNRPPNLLTQKSASPQEMSDPMATASSAASTSNSSPVHQDPFVIPASYQQSAESVPAARRASPASGALDAKLIAASVRLRIEDPNGNSCGSGTIIDTRGNEALILTCGHIFRDSHGKGKIEVDLFGPQAAQRVEGRLISYDLQRDVGLLTIRSAGPIVAARLAPPDYKLQKGDKVASVGCDNGSEPTVRYSYVTSIDRYAGPSNLQVAGQPTEGRSGGGLFTTDGMVIGVCNARDPQDQEGYFAALNTICAQLDQSGLDFVYRDPQTQNNTSPMLASNGRPSTMPHISPANANLQAIGAMGQSPSRALNHTEQAALEEIRRHLKQGAEVICVVRPRNNPQAKSQVIMIDKASPEFIAQLAAEAKSKEGRQLTSLELSRPKQPALQWSSNANGWRAGQ
ncbi:MAG: trypsin-like peptidase domain-containing protein [Thermoguttaceae bacterium]